MSERQFSTIGVIGLGTMGAGIAEVFARNGYDVIGLEINDEHIVRGREHLEHSTGRAVRREKMTEAEQKELLDRITLTTDMADLAKADFVVEAVVLGLLGGILGVGLGRILAALMLDRVSASMTRQHVTPIDVAAIHFDVRHAALGVLAGTLAALVASAWPAWRATTVRCSEAKRWCCVSFPIRAATGCWSSILAATFGWTRCRSRCSHLRRAIFGSRYGIARIRATAVAGYIRWKPMKGGAFRRRPPSPSPQYRNGRLNSAESSARQLKPLSWQNATSIR